jgi:hypothetical protein
LNMTLCLLNQWWALWPPLVQHMSFDVRVGSPLRVPTAWLPRQKSLRFLP